MWIDNHISIKLCRLDVNIVINIIICLYVNAIFDDDVIEFIFRLGWEVKNSALRKTHWKTGRK